MSFEYQCFSPKQDGEFVLYVVTRNGSFYNLAKGLEDAFSRGFTSKEANTRYNYIGGHGKRMFVALNAPEGTTIPRSLVGSIFVEGKYKISDEAVEVPQLSDEYKDEVSRDNKPDTVFEINWEELSTMKNNAANRSLLVEMAKKRGVVLDPSKMKTVNALLGGFKEGLGAV